MKLVQINTDILSNVELLTKAEAGELLLALLRYAKNGTEFTTDNRPLAMVYSLAVEEIRKQEEKRKEIGLKRAEAGRRGNEVRWNRKPSQTIAKIANATNVSQTIASNRKNRKCDNDEDLEVVDNEVIAENTDTKVNQTATPTTENPSQKEIPLTSPLKENTPTPLKEIYPPIIPQEKHPRSSGAKSNFDERQQEFYYSLVEYLPKYGKEMIREFFDYWSEPNKSRTKMRWELERTWDSARRLATWDRRNKNNFNNGNNKNDTPESRAAAVAVQMQRLMSEPRKSDAEILRELEWH